MSPLTRLCVFLYLLVSLFAVNSVSQISPAFTPATYIPTGTTQTEPTGVAVGDLNGDGNLDLVVVNKNQDNGTNVAVLLGNGDGTFRTAVTYDVGVQGYYPYPTIALGDFNNDGKLDVVVDMAIAGNPPNTLFLFLGNGDGTLGAPTSLPGYPSPFR